MNILLYAPKFHGYENDIIDHLKSKGHTVTFFDCVIRPSFKERIGLKISKKHMRNKYTEYVRNIIDSIKGEKFDLFVTILGDFYLNHDHIMMFKNALPDTRFVYYAWDSISNYPNILEFADEFDEKLSFDPHDAEKYNFKFLPLFYRNSYEEADIEYDYSAIMTFHYNKAGGYKRALSAMGKDKVGFNYLYYFDKGRYNFNKLLHPGAFKNIPKDYFKFSTIDKKSVNHVIGASKAVIDIPLARQNGLTIRVFEIIRQNKKIITSNKDIKQYNFYSPENIFVLEENNYIPEEFWTTPCKYNEKDVSMFSLETFCSQLFGEYKPLKYLK